jgi:hypothetical protein
VISPKYNDTCLDPEIWSAQAKRSTPAFRLRKSAVLDCLNRLHPALQRIVDTELKRNNAVSDAGENYPHPGSIHVTMKHRFNAQHATDAARFSLCNDPHYWHADYSTIEQPSHLLIC